MGRKRCPPEQIILMLQQAHDRAATARRHSAPDDARQAKPMNSGLETGLERTWPDHMKRSGQSGRRHVWERRITARIFPCSS